MKYLLSYPRSGNHLVRFFIELLCETPTIGVEGSEEDIPLYQNTYTIDISFNISRDTKYEIEQCYQKFHKPIPSPAKDDTLIFLLRSPRECLIRQNGFATWNENRNWYSYNAYFELIDSYLAFPGKKCVLFYEDIITNRASFIMQLYDYLELQNQSKLNYVLQNLDGLFVQSINGKGRYWGGVRSNGNLVFYYPRITEKIKVQFDEYISKQVNKPQYEFIKYKYKIS
jgi:hypothetical protein